MEWQTFIRDTWQTALVLVSLLVFTRILGNTQIGQLTLYEYVSGITIGSIAGNVAAAEPRQVWSHFYDLVLFVALTFFISVLTLKSRPLRKLIQGSATVVIQNGQIIEHNMRNLRYDLDELIGQLREKGIFDLAEVQYAAIETTGGLSVIKQNEYQPLTKGDYGVQTPQALIPIEVILDGELIEENLKENHISRDWLRQQLAGQKVTDIAQVMYAVIDTKGQLYISKKHTDG